MEMNPVVIDTNCLLQIISRKSPYRPIWDAFLEGRYHLCVSNEIPARAILRFISYILRMQKMQILVSSRYFFFIYSSRPLTRFHARSLHCELP